MADNKLDLDSLNKEFDLIVDKADPKETEAFVKKVAKRGLSYDYCSESPPAKPEASIVNRSKR